MIVSYVIINADNCHISLRPSNPKNVQSSTDTVDYLEHPHQLLVLAINPTATIMPPRPR